MTDQDNTLNEPYPNPVAAFDVEGLNSDSEAADGDTDTEAHGYRRMADAESAEGDDDVEGHGMTSGRADAESAEGQEVAGHVYIENRDDLNQQRLR
jgi:hypothetical protein